MDAQASHGLLHRLDRDTSGVLIWAASYHSYLGARLKFAARLVLKEYVCLCHEWLRVASEVPFLLEVPLLEASWVSTALGGTRRTVAGAGGLPSITEVRAMGALAGPGGARFSLVEVRLHTGRRHQIRAHLGGRGHPLVGDVLYGGSAPPWCRRMFLQAYRVRIDIGAGLFEAKAPLPADLRGAMGLLAAPDRAAGALLRKWS